MHRYIYIDTSIDKAKFSEYLHVRISRENMSQPARFLLFYLGFCLCVYTNE